MYILSHFHTNSSKLLPLSRSSELEKSDEIRCVRKIFEELPMGEKIKKPERLGKAPYCVGLPL